MKLFAGILCLIALRLWAQPADFVCIDSFPALTTDIRYATTNNFAGVNLYGERKTTYLHPIAAERLLKACKLLQMLKPGWKLVILDALRPRSAQKILWETVRGTPKWKYVASPSGTSVHSYGLAVDVTLEDAYGVRVDMGTEYDDFTKRSEPRFEQEMLRRDSLSAVQVANRRFLRALMKQAGWRSVLNEWWHFEVYRREQVKGRFQLVD